MNQASSSRLQVVTLASSKTVDSPEMKRMFFAQPRMLRGAYSYSASDMSPVRGEILKRMDGPEKEAPWREMRALPTASTSSVSLRVGDSVALEDGAGAADLRVAVKVELVFGVAFDAVGGHETRGVRVGRCAGRIERRHGFEGHHAACLSGRRNGGVGHGGQRDAYADRGLSGTRE